jgi:hypothetical protein
VEQCFKQLRKLIESERVTRLWQGAVLVEMIDRHHLRAFDIARQTNQRPGKRRACGSSSTFTPRRTARPT